MEFGQIWTSTGVSEGCCCCTFTCKERSVLQGSLTDTGVYGLGDQRVNPEGVLIQTHALVWGSVLRCFIRPFFHQVQGNGARCYPKAHLSLNIYHVSDLTGRDFRDVATPPEACNSKPCNRSPKMRLSFSASGTWLINYTLALTLQANLCRFYKFVQAPLCQCGTVMICVYLQKWRCSKNTWGHLNIWGVVHWGQEGFICLDLL